MAFKTTSYASSSSSHSVAEPKELLLVLSILNEKQKLRNKQQEVKEQAVVQQYQQQENQHLHYQHQHHYHDRKKHKQLQQLQESKSQTGEREYSTEQRMEWSQIELIYRAEGNANLVLALPQFKKVLRLPKFYKKHKQKALEQQPQHQETKLYNQQQQQQQNFWKQQKQQDEMNRQEPNMISTTGQEQSESNGTFYYKY